MTEMEDITGSVETLKPFDDEPSEFNRRSITPDVIPKMMDVGRQTTESVEHPVAARATMQAEALNSAYMVEEGALATLPAFKVENQSTRQCNGFDDIEFADDVKICCIEKREPNGKVYFIEMDLTTTQSPQTTSSASSDSFGEDVIIREMVDKVLLQSERDDHEHRIVAVDRKATPPRSDDGAVSEDDSEVEDAEIETRAIVHTINDVKDVDMPTVKVPVKPEVEVADQPVSVTTDKKPFFTFGVYRTPSSSQIENSPSNSVGRSKEFKDRLTRLLGQFSEEPAKTPSSLERKRSISISDNINKASMAEVRRPSLKRLVADGGSNDGIPAAPKFDQLMYNTVGRRMRTQPNQFQVPATAMSIENEFAKSFDRLKTSSSHMHRSKKSDDLMKLFDLETEASEEAASVSSIRDRLNEIYSRGRPPIATFTEETANSEPTDSRRNSEEGIQLRKPVKPYDTVHKQKQLFSDVLKSINPEVRNSLHRTESIASADVKAATHKD